MTPAAGPRVAAAIRSGLLRAQASARRRPDAWLAPAIVVLAYVVGVRDVTDWTRPGEFYQNYFDIAVMEACGFGFVAPDENHPPLLHFVQRTADEIDCAAIPPDLPRRPPDAFQRTHRALLRAVSLLWSIRGAAWSKLAPLFGVLFAMSALATYGLFRLAAPPGFATAGTLALIASPVQLAMLPFLRDYGKAPFILATLFFAGVLAVKPPGPRPAALISLAAGLTLGIGLGFRIDCVIVLPVFLAALAVFSEGSIGRRAARTAIGATVFLAAFVAAGFPTLKSQSQFDALSPNRASGVNYDSMLLGLATPFDKAIGVTTAPYELAYLYNDTHVQALVNAAAAAKGGGTTFLEAGLPEYEAVSRSYLLEIYRRFPADALVRLYGAALRTLDLPVTGLANQLYLDPNEQKITLRDDCIMAFYRGLQALLMPYLRGAGALAWAVALLAISRRSWKLAAFVLLTMIYLAGYGQLQFSLRNSFHLEFLAVWPVVFLLSGAWRLRPWRARPTAAAMDVERASGGPSTRSSVRRMAAFGVVTAAILVGLLEVLRAYQEPGVRRVVEAIAAAPTQPLALTAIDAGDRVLLAPSDFPRRATPDAVFAAEYLVIDLAEHRPFLPVIVRYEPIAASVGSYWDHTRTYVPRVPWSREPLAPDASSRFVIPVFAGPPLRFAGVEISRAHVSAIRLSRFTQTPPGPLLWLTLRPGWQRERFYQALRGWRHGTRAVFPPDVPRTATDLDPFLYHPLRAGDIASRDEAVVARGKTVEVNGPLSPARPTLVQYGVTSVSRGQQLIARGFNYWGCFDVILVKAGQFLTVPVVDPGPFDVTIEVPEPGKYTPVIGGGACNGWNRFTIAEIGWRTVP